MFSEHELNQHYASLSPEQRLALDTAQEELAQCLTKHADSMAASNPIMGLLMKEALMSFMTDLTASARCGFPRRYIEITSAMMPNKTESTQSSGIH
jgi:hypothetical protein